MIRTETIAAYNCPAIKIPCRITRRALAHVSDDCFLPDAHQSGSFYHLAVDAYGNRSRELTHLVKQVYCLYLDIILTYCQC